MKPNDDALWVESLAGRSRTEADSEGRALAEGAALRAGILARTVDTGPNPAEHDELREDALIEKARAAGLLPRRSPASAATRPGAAPRGWLPLLAGWRGALAVATLAGAAALFLFVFVMRTGPSPVRPPEIVRSPPDRTFRLQARDPAALQLEIIDELRAAGVAATGYERLGRRGIDADLPKPLPEEVRRILDRHKIPVPTNDILAVEIVASEPR